MFGAVAAAGAPERLVQIAPGELLPLLPNGSSLLVLSGSLRSVDGNEALGPGDVLVSLSGDPAAMRYRNVADAPHAAGGSAVVLIDRAAPATFGNEPRRIARDELVGKPFPGITGIRALHTSRSSVVVRLGPPPGARWVIVGFRSMAVFVGKMTVIENDGPRDVAAGNLVLVADPTATLYVQAGNDAAIALGFAAPDVLVALG